MVRNVLWISYIFYKHKVYILLLLLFNRLPPDITSSGQGLKNIIFNFFTILQYWYWYGRLYKKKFRTLISIGFVSPPLIFRIRRRRGRRWSFPPPFPNPHLLSASYLSVSVFLYVAGRIYWRERGEGVGWGAKSSEVGTSDRIVIFRFSDSYRTSNVKLSQLYPTEAKPSFDLGKFLISKWNKPCLFQNLKR